VDVSILRGSRREEHRGASPSSEGAAAAPTDAAQHRRRRRRDVGRERSGALCRSRELLAPDDRQRAAAERGVSRRTNEEDSIPCLWHANRYMIPRERTVMASSSEAGGGAIRSRSERLLNGLAPDGTAPMGEECAATPDEAAKHGRGDGDPHMDERGSRTGGRGAQTPARQTRPSLPPPRRATVRRGGERPRATTPDRRGRCAGTEVITNPAEEGRAAPLTGNARVTPTTSAARRQ